jgi:hypothetical protein
MIQRLTILILVLLTAAVVPVRAQVDTSTPKAAVKSLYGAVAKGDAAVVRQVLMVDGDPEQHFAAGYADLILAGKHLADAAKSKYPGVADAFTRGTILPEDVAKVDSAKVSIDGENATVKINDRDEPLKLRQTNGAWRVVVGTPGSVSTPAQRENQMNLIKGLIAAMSQCADEITADKYATAQEAEAAVKERLGAVVAKALQNEPPTSRPTSKP